MPAFEAACEAIWKGGDPEVELAYLAPRVPSVDEDWILVSLNRFARDGRGVVCVRNPLAPTLPGLPNFEQVSRTVWTYDTVQLW